MSNGLVFRCKEIKCKVTSSTGMIEPSLCEKNVLNLEKIYNICKHLRSLSDRFVFWRRLKAMDSDQVFETEHPLNIHQPNPLVSFVDDVKTGTVTADLSEEDDERFVLQIKCIIYMSP